MSMIVDFPIGQLSVATSRENLGMDEATIRNLKVGMGQVMNEITAQISADIAKEPSYYEACKALARISGTPLMGLAGTPKWNGLDVFLRFELHETETGKLEHCFFGEGADAQGKLLPYLKFRDSGYGATVDYDQLQEQVVVVEFEDCKRAVSRMRRFLLEQAEPGIAVHWLRMQRNQLAGWQARNGGKPIIDLDTIEPLTSPKAKPRGEDAPIPMRRMIVKNQRPYRHFDAEFWASEDVHPTEDMFIVQGNLKECYPTSNVYRGMSTNEFAAKCAKLRVAGVFDGNTSVFFVSATQAKRVKLTNVMERIREIVEQKFGTNVSLEEETWEYRKNRQIAQQLRGLKLTLPKDLADFAKFYPETQSTLTSDQVEVIKEWIPTARTRTADHVHADRRGKIFNTYPLLEITSGRETHLRHYLKLELKK
ncbi:hypothetical protein, partial [Palleronia sp.]|uniref:hypothetical protein n=1 Tax=Palleronia sp. TaxID=1940284 RepID=UPI0035C7FA2A